MAAELVRALRGRRSQAGLSRRLGYRSNIVQRWESGQCWPTAARFFTACKRLGIDLDVVLTHFHGRRPAWLDDAHVTSSAGVARWLRDLRGKTPIGSIAETAGVTRFRVSRWLKDEAQPRLPELLLMIDVSSRRLLDFVAALTNPERLPSLASAYQELQRAREAAYRHPWSHAVLRALELPQPTAAHVDQRAWLAETLGIDAKEVARSLAVLEQSGQARKRRGRHAIARVVHVNTSADPVHARALKQLWAEVAIERLAAGRPGLFGYTLFAASREDLRRMRDLQLQYVREMQSLVSHSRGSECVGLHCVQLLDLSVREDNALRADRPRPPKRSRGAT